MNSVLLSLAAPAACLSRPDCGRIGVSFFLGERSGVQRASQRLFGRKLEGWEYAGLAGAPDGARVELGTIDGGLYLETRDRAARLYRVIQRVRPTDLASLLEQESFAAGSAPRCRVRPGPVLVIEALHILRPTMRGGGLGLGMLARQLAFARWLGVSKIETCAGRSAEENGYYTWPRFGFDGPLPPQIRRTLPPDLDRAESVLDLIECDDGRRWWSQHGTTLDVAFDLAPESRSWNVFRRYVREKSGPGAAPLGSSATN